MKKTSKETSESKRTLRFEYVEDNTWSAFSPQRETKKGLPKRSYVMVPVSTKKDTSLDVTLWMDGHIAYVHYEPVEPYHFKAIDVFYNHLYPKKLESEQHHDKEVAKKIAADILTEFLKQKETLEKKLPTKKK